MSQKAPPLTYKKLFNAFLKSGLTFGGGLGILAVLEKEFVTNTKYLDRKEFLSMYGIGKIIPSGSVTALAVGIGYKFKGFRGSIVALCGMILPGFVSTVALAALYTNLRDTIFFDLINTSLLPAAMGTIVISAISLGKEVYRSIFLAPFAILAFIAAFFLNINPALLIILFGIIAIFLFPHIKDDDNVTY